MRLSRADFSSSLQEFFEHRICFPRHHRVWRAGADSAILSDIDFTAESKRCFPVRKSAETTEPST